MEGMMTATDRTTRAAAVQPQAKSPRTVTNDRSWLPPIDLAGHRYWFPKRMAAIEPLAMGMMGDADQGSPTGNSERISPIDEAGISPWIRPLCRVLATEPSLAIYAALMSGGGPLSKVATGLVRDLADRLTAGTAPVPEPAIDDAGWDRFEELDRYLRTQPIDRWMQHAVLYLQVTGPRPSAELQGELDSLRLAADDAATHPATASPDFLQRLASQTRELRDLRQRFDDRLHRSKMDALVQLAYGLSHELNNPLANIASRAEACLRPDDSNGEPSRRRRYLRQIIDQVYRGHSMISDLMFYANPPRPQRVRCNLFGPIDDAVQRHTTAESAHDVRIELCGDGFLEANVDPTMIEEAVGSLLRNAIEALAGQGAIVVTVWRDGSHGVIAVADSGPGLSESARKHAFDPYFSGREAGRGLGLGLCRAWRIVRLHDGDLDLAASPAGCVATIRLPLGEAEPS